MSSKTRPDRRQARYICPATFSSRSMSGSVTHQMKPPCRTSSGAGHASMPLPVRTFFTVNQDGALRAPWADPCAGLRPWGPRPARAGPHAIVPLIMAGHPAGHPVLDIAVFLGASSVPLPATASRSLPAVASHAIGYAEPRPGTRSPGFRRLSRMTEGTRTRPRDLRCDATAQDGPPNLVEKVERRGAELSRHQRAAMITGHREVFRVRKGRCQLVDRIVLGSRDEQRRDRG
jgi:hypothetical protein